MKTWQKIILGLAATGTLALIGIVVALKILFPPDRIKEIAVSKLEESLGREVKLAKASIGLGGVTLNDLEISEIPNFKAGTVASLKSLSVALEWKPLIFEKDIRVTNLSIDAIDVNVIVKKEEKAVKKEGPAPTSKSKSAETPQFLLAKLSISNGKVAYRDETTGTSASLSNLNFKSSEITPSKPFPLEVSADFNYGKTKGSIDFSGTIDPQKGDLEKAGAIIDSLDLVWDGMKYAMSGELKPAAAPAGDLTVTLPAMEAGGLNIPMLKGTLHAKYKDELISITKMNLKGDGASLNGSVFQTKSGWKLKKLTADLEGIAATLDGLYSEKEIDLRVQSGELNLEAAHRWVPALKEAAATGMASIDVTAKGKTQSPALTGDVTLNDASLTSSGQVLSKLNGELSFTPKKIDAALKGALNAAPFDVKGAVSDYRGNHPKVSLNGTLTKLDLSKLPESKKGHAKAGTKGEPTGEKEAALKMLADAEGTITIGAITHPRFQASKSTMKWDLKNIGSDLSKLDGVVAFNVGAGKFDDLKQLGASNPMVKMVLLPIMIIQKVAGLVKVPAFPSFDKVQFSEIVGDYVVTKGIMTVKKSHLASNVADVNMTGKADLGKDKLDLRVNAKIAKVGLKAPVAFKVTGTMADPKVKLDVKAILKQPEVKQATDMLKKEGEKLLRGLFGR